MFHDILIPDRIGSYYFYKKRILSFEITPMIVQGLLIEFTGKSIQIKNKQSILLKDFSVQTQSNALKKIASSIGKYDEIITTLSSSAIVYKELKLPFIGRDALAMVVPYEVEALLPFSLEEAVVDFIITKQDMQKKESTLLVAAIRIQDLQTHRSLFEKAELLLDVVTIDIFTLSELYQASLSPTDQSTALQTQSKQKLLPFDFQSSSMIALWHKIHTKIFKQSTIDQSTIEQSTIEQSPTTITSVKFQPKESELLVDIGFDVTRVLYFQDGLLIAVRMIPSGIADVAQTMSHKTELPYFDIIQNILTGPDQPLLEDELKKIFEEITRTLQFFEKQENTKYINPSKIWLSGFGTNAANFQDQAQIFFNTVVTIIHSDIITQRLKISVIPNDHNFSVINLALGLFVHFEPNVNFLKSVAQKSDNALLTKQLIMIVCMTIICLGTTFWRSFSILQEKENAYSSSKRQFIQTIEQRMRIDLRGEKNIKTIVEKAEDKLKTEKTLWSVFSAQQNHSILEYLQDLSVQIDRMSIGLQVRTMHLDYEKVNITGSVKSFETLDVFEEELQSLQLLQLLEKPRELSFTIQFKPKENAKGPA